MLLLRHIYQLIIITMIFLEIVAIIVIAIIILNHNSRITKLEKSSSIVSAVKPAPNQSVESTPLVTKPVVLNPVQETIVKKNSEEVSGRMLGKIGITAVIIGISFFLKYAFDNNWVGPAGRVMIGIIIGVALLGLGQYLRKKYIRYSDLLMGGGIAVLYLSIFSAHFFYHLITPATAGIFMFLITALAFTISIVNATITLALISVIGGFATPFLANSGNNAMMTLFGYIIVLNLGIMAISFFRKWPELVLVAFIGSLINFGAWFGSYYAPDVLVPTLLFCFITFLIFLVASVARAVTAKTISDPLNYFLLGINAFAFAFIGYYILKPDYEGVLGFASVFIALIYMVVAFIVNKSNHEDKALNIFLPGLAVTFLSIAVPMQLSGPWIAVAWLVESVVIYCVASFISNRGFQVMGLAVYILGLINMFVWNYPRIGANNFTIFFNSHFVILIIAIITAYIISFLYFRFGSDSTIVQKRGIVAFIIIANILTIYAFSSQIIFYYNSMQMRADATYNISIQDAERYNTGYDTSAQKQEATTLYYSNRESTSNRSNTYVSIFWVIYAAVLTTIGFGKKLVMARRLGLVLFTLSACKVVIDVWSLGQLYRIVSFIVFGIVALAASFAYVKYKDRL
ncbi:MAG: DUF2339 domain-containing protein [Patescibacteria group bacterium]